MTGPEADGRERNQTQDPRERGVDDRDDALMTRETQVEAREAQVEAREMTEVERLEESRVIRADAEARDESADGRDWDAGKRDMAANLQSWLHKDDGDGDALARRDAAQRDRKDARADRMSAAVDRARLTEDDDPRDGDGKVTADL